MPTGPAEPLIVAHWRQTERKVFSGLDLADSFGRFSSTSPSVTASDTDPVVHTV